MKFKIESQHLRQASTWTRSVTENIQTDRMLGCLLVEAGTDSIKFRSTDRNLEMECRIPAVCESTGSITVMAKTLNDFARRVPDGAQLYFEHDYEKSRLTITSNRTKATLPTLPSADFPQMASEDYTTSFEIGAETLGRLLEKSRIAVCQDPSRDYLCGVNMHVVRLEEGRFLRCIATDGFMMAIADTDVPEGLEEMPTTLIPTKAVGEAIKVFAHGGEPVQVSFSEGKIRFANQQASLSSRLLNKRDYPDYFKLIPNNNPHSLKVDSAMMKEALLRVSVVADRFERIVIFEIKEDILRMTVQDPQEGVITEELPVDFPLESYRIGFKIALMASIIDQVGEGELVIKCQPTPGAVKITGENDDNLLFLLMPKKI